jgi:hypothetical protein
MGAGNKDFWDAVPWLIAVVGWGFTHVFSEARERRKEVRSQLDKGIEQLLTLEKSAREFHMSAKYDPLKAHELTAGLDTFERKLYRISCVDVDGLTANLIALRRAVTLDNFDASSFTAQSSASEVLGKIADAASNMEEVLEAQYGFRYPNRFPYFRLRGHSRNHESRIS